VTDLDLEALGIWRLPIPSPDAGASINAWAIEDLHGAVALFDCGFDAPGSIDAVVLGLDRAGATLADVRRIIVSHAHPEHCGGVKRVVEGAAGPSTVLASAIERRALAAAGVRSSVQVLRDGDCLHFRRFAARALLMPGHTAGLTCLFADGERVFFSSDHLLHELSPGLAPGGGENRDLSSYVQAYRASLARVAALEVRVVLPGRGAPFAGHRRVVREVLARLGQPEPGGAGSRATEERGGAWRSTKRTRPEAVGSGEVGT